MFCHWFLAVCFACFFRYISRFHDRTTHECVGKAMCVGKLEDIFTVQLLVSISLSIDIFMAIIFNIVYAWKPLASSLLIGFAFLSHCYLINDLIWWPGPENYSWMRDFRVWYNLVSFIITICLSIPSELRSGSLDITSHGDRHINAGLFLSHHIRYSFCPKYKLIFYLKFIFKFNFPKASVKRDWELMRVG